METRLLSSFPLENGLTLVCLDQSKKIVGDHWYVCVQVSITIPVEKKWFTNYPMDEVKFNKILSALGKEIVFKQKHERNFVSDIIKEDMVKKMCSSAEKLGKKYFCKDAFAAKYILKNFADLHRHR